MNPNIKCTCPFGNPQIGIDDNCPIHGVKEHETITTAGEQPLSPQSSVGVEEKQNILDNIPLDEEGHREFFTKKEVFQAMTEYSSLMNKEKDREIERLKGLISKAHRRGFNAGSPEKHYEIKKETAAWETFKTQNNL